MLEKGWKRVGAVTDSGESPLFAMKDTRSTQSKSIDRDPNTVVLICTSDLDIVYYIEYLVSTQHQTQVFRG